VDDVVAQPTRRSVLKVGTGALATVVLGGSAVLVSARRAAADVVNARLYVSAGERTMIDGLVVPVVGFGSTPDRVELPGGQLEVQTGDTVNLTITNQTDLAIGFRIPGVAGAAFAPQHAGTTRTITFTAPASPGTWYYVGTVSGSVDTGRALGVTGAFVVLPQGPRETVEALFPGVAGKARRQPMHHGVVPPGVPTTVRRERTWLFSELNPDTARDLAGGRVALPSDPEPEYFLINGISGMLSVEDPQTRLTGSAGGLGQLGDAHLLRMINTGRAPRSIHMHGNHFWVLSHPDTPWIVGAHKDTVRIPSGTAVDVLVPFEAPPDAFPVVQRGQKYVVHDHIEMAETASGGHYPSGMVSVLLLE
jgi:FtsP/CotA-like multicopper oxidase with cupredoxin domain